MLKLEPEQLRGLRVDQSTALRLVPVGAVHVLLPGRRIGALCRVRRGLALRQPAGPTPPPRPHGCCGPGLPCRRCLRRSARCQLLQSYSRGQEVRYDDVRGGKEDDEEEATSWLLLDPLKGADGNAPFGDALVADFLDLGGAGEKDASSKECSSHGKTSEGSHHEFIVPGEPVALLPERQCFVAEMAYDASSPKHGYGIGATLGHSVSMLASPDNSSTVLDCAAPDITSPYLRRTESAIDLFSVAGPSVAHMSPQLMAMDREARVHRYREKRKTRRFEKTIRYASRKAYAETRPRIKGRFAKRADADLEAGRPVLLSHRAVRLQLRCRADVLVSGRERRCFTVVVGAMAVNISWLPA